LTMNLQKILNATAEMMVDMAYRWDACGSPVTTMSSKQARLASLSKLGLNYREMALPNDVERIDVGPESGLLHPVNGRELRRVSAAEWFSDGESRVEKSTDAMRMLCIVAEYDGGSPFVINIRLIGGTVGDCVSNSLTPGTPKRVCEAVSSLVKLVLAAAA